MIKMKLTKGKSPVLVWSDEVESSALDQLKRMADLSVVHGHIAVMPEGNRLERDCSPGDSRPETRVRINEPLAGFPGLALGTRFFMQVIAKRAVDEITVSLLCIGNQVYGYPGPARV